MALLRVLVRDQTCAALSRPSGTWNNSCLWRILPTIVPGLSQPSPCHMHSSSALRLENNVQGVNDCPTNCLCSNDINANYKNVRLLSQFVSTQTGMILPRTITKVCMSKQREIAKAIRRARTMGFMPFTEKMLEYLNDPKLF